MTKVTSNVKKYSLIIGLGLLIGLLFNLSQAGDNADAKTIDVESQMCLAKNI